ncbi:hypothetical protein G7Z99_14765 [Pseudomonas entomophila]|uniref:hypothetical protein n=1 Tax=Pseudomonas entomophila TaxID=312306 RepID=UPI0015E363C0|nr:hypothetical protein [Pseudomonas entomophila]MBA1190297.1 hypothetical protein [Pseudomonas entomophila]
MVVVEDVKAWVNSVEYDDLLKNVCKKLQVKVNHESQPNVVWQLDVKKLNLAELNIDDISVVAKGYELVAEYVKKKLISSETNPDEQEGGDPEDDEDDDVEVHAFYKSFLNLYLIELHFLKFNPAGLENYLKLIRIPFAKKYAAQISKIYRELT